MPTQDSFNQDKSLNKKSGTMGSDKAQPAKSGFETPRSDVSPDSKNFDAGETDETHDMSSDEREEPWRQQDKTPPDVRAGRNNEVNR